MSNQQCRDGAVTENSVDKANNYHLRQAEDPIRSIDDLYRSIQREIQWYKKEHEEIRADLKRLVQNNQGVVGDVLGVTGVEENGNESGVDSEQYKRISNEVIGNLKNQLEIVWEVRWIIEFVTIKLLPQIEVRYFLSFI